MLTLYDSGSGKARPKRDLGLVWTPKNLAMVNAKEIARSSTFTVDVNPANDHARRGSGGGGGALGGREEVGGGGRGGRRVCLRCLGNWRSYSGGSGGGSSTGEKARFCP